MFILWLQLSFVGVTVWMFTSFWAQFHFAAPYLVCFSHSFISHWPRVCACVCTVGVTRYLVSHLVGPRRHLFNGHVVHVADFLFGRSSRGTKLNILRPGKKGIHTSLNSIINYHGAINIKYTLHKTVQDHCLTENAASHRFSQLPVYLINRKRRDDNFL